MDNFKPICRAISTTLRLLTYLFLALRACDITDWAWYVVLSPALVSLGIWLFCCTVAAMMAAAVNGE